MSSITLRSEHICFGGTVGFYSHTSAACNSEMRFAVFVPPQAKQSPTPILYFLSGLTCTEENFTTKAGAQQFAAKYGLMLVAPDTSPRGTGIPGEDDDWDLGTGAGFYVDATEAPWRSHYRMYSYVTEELPALIAQNFPGNPQKQGIFGHSMGGHGALICALKNPTYYQSVSAFAPIAAPMQCPWGQKAFSHYLGLNLEDWKAYDASELILTTQLPYPILIDQGMADTFLQTQLMPDVFGAACAQVGQPLHLRRQPGYDHSYYFISTFIADHIRYHAERLGS
ncbi:MAG TPA: S-formylglutathione hydrolase [Synechococcales cyanobacterium M55_K2018_004]|nr:S-formylglutathione hydrolase [Synechococcales cyanobacterium M55_K2018_004]